MLWFEHDLFDQLQLIQVLSQCPGRPELIVVGAFEGYPDFHGLGELIARRARDAVAAPLGGRRRRARAGAYSVGRVPVA